MKKKAGLLGALAAFSLGIFPRRKVDSPIPSDAHLLPPGYYTRDPWRNVVQSYQFGKKVRHIARAYNISRQEVINILKQRGVWHGTKN